MHEVLVVGGGLAGAAAACHLAAAGRDVALVERERGPRDKVCGEFLSYEALHYLAELGIDPAALGAPSIHAVGIANGARMSSRSLPFPAFSLSRRRLDEALLERAAAVGVRLERGRGVKALEAARHGGWEARLDDGRIVSARDAFLATGKHDLKNRRRPTGRQNDLVGLKLHYRLDPMQAAALAGRVELFAFRGGYGGLEPIEDGLANLCLLVRKNRFAEAGNRWEALLSEIGRDCPHLARRLGNAVPIHEKPLAVAFIPYGFVRRVTEGIWHLGDQAAVIPSFAGEGMSIALHSGRLAARLHLAGRSATEFQGRLAGDVSRQVRIATAVSRLITAEHTAPLLLAGLRMMPAAITLLAARTRLAPAAMQ